MSILIEQSAWIDRPCDEVFAFAGDYRNDPKWREGVKSMSVIEGGEPALGKTTQETLYFMGSRYETTARITCYERGKKTAFESTQAQVPVSGHREFQAEAGRTRITYVLSMKPSGLLALFSPVLRILYQRVVKRDLERLRKAMVEGNGD